MQSSRLCDKRASKCAARLGALALLACLTACERPLPPAPNRPNRPQSMNERQAPQVRKAIFRYNLPCAQSRHPQRPQADSGDCSRLQV